MGEPPSSGDACQDTRIRVSLKGIMDTDDDEEGRLTGVIGLGNATEA